MIVLDTNVLLSGLYSRRGASFKILTLCLEGKVDFVLTPLLFMEYSGKIAEKAESGLMYKVLIQDLRLGPGTSYKKGDAVININNGAKVVDCLFRNNYKKGGNSTALFYTNDGAYSKMWSINSRTEFNANYIVEGWRLERFEWYSGDRRRANIFDFASNFSYKDWRKASNPKLVNNEVSEVYVDLVTHDIYYKTDSDEWFSRDQVVRDPDAIEETDRSSYFTFEGNPLAAQPAELPADTEFDATTGENPAGNWYRWVKPTETE